jgi:hypothetical protein
MQEDLSASLKDRMTLVDGIGLQVRKSGGEAMAR